MRMRAGSRSGQRRSPTSAKLHRCASTTTRPASTCSRTRRTPTGRFRPPAWSRLRRAAGVKLLALTDHDTVDGVDEALAAADEHGDRGRARGRDLDVRRARRRLPRARLRHRPHRRGARRALAAGAPTAPRGSSAWRTCSATVGLPPDRSVLDARLDAGLPVGRPHLAAAAIDANSERAARRGTDGAVGVPRGLPRPRLPRLQPPHDAQRRAGDRGDPRGRRRRCLGASVLGPRRASTKWPTRWRASRASGLDGVEAFYATHDREQTQLLVALAAAHGLLTTGSADFHGPDHRLFSRFRAFELYGCEPTAGGRSLSRARRGSYERP